MTDSVVYQVCWRWQAGLTTTNGCSSPLNKDGVRSAGDLLPRPGPDPDPANVR